jgi:hypothetical protein
LLDEASAAVLNRETPAADDDQQRSGRLLSAKEQSWRTGSSVRSLLSRTTRSGRLATGARSRRTVAERGTR